MITKINKIKDFGIFKNFSWDTGTTPFKKKNLIYGWNYSGKTTFSKLFSNLEKKSKVHFPTSEYTFELENTTTYTQDVLDTFPYFTKVFNTQYVKTVFSWDKENNEGFEPILFYLGEVAGDIQPKIDSLRDRWSPKIEAIKKNYAKIVTAFDEYSKDSGKFSKQATEIRKYLNDQIKNSDFNKGHFISLVSEVKLALATHVQLHDKVEEIKQQAIATNEFIAQNEINTFVENIKIIGGKVKTILEANATQSVPFPELDGDPVLFKWVQTGVGLHKESKKCKFCDEDLKQERIDSLNQYYSEKLKEIQDGIKIIRTEIEVDVAGLNFNFPHESTIIKHHRERYKEAKKNFETQKKVYIKELEIFEVDLKTKEGKYFTTVPATYFKEITINAELERVIEVIKEHNLFVTNFDDNKKDALKLILRHYVAEYLTTENYLTKETESKSASEIVKRCIAKILENDTEILRLSGLLNDTVKGQEELNIYLKIFLNQNDILIDIANEKYVLKRGTLEATNLSEGEKTAIAFAYFLTELKSLKKENNLKDTIIFFDDPISSLDSNHIFQVRSLIQNFFANPADYLQLFISTHNFEFFSVLLDSTLFNNNPNSQDSPKPFYLINRTAENISTFKNLPKTLRSHKSEYAHIFHILKEYNVSINKDDFEFKILLPNALRRFLELYSLFKYPKGYCEIDERLKMVFSVDEAVAHNTKLYHWFSHQQQFEKVAQHDSKLILIDDAISEVMLHLKNKDPLHWSGLTGEE
jgi:wobble nucleotide-excising tRNase